MFIGASKSKKPSIGMLSWAITLAKWDCERQKSISFGQKILACMYHGLSYASRRHYNGPTDIPFWLLQAWGEAYFSNTDMTVNASKNQEPSNPILILEYIKYFSNKDNIRQRTSFRAWMPLREQAEIPVDKDFSLFKAQPSLMDEAFWHNIF